MTSCKVSKQYFDNILKPLIKEINLPEGEETFFLDTDEIKRLIYGLKPGTAAGPSGISVELL